MAYVNAFVIKNPASIKIDDVEYKTQVWKVEGTPDQPVQTQRTFGGVDQDVDSATWVLAISGHNSRKAGALVKAIDTAAAAGDTMEVVIQLKAGTGQDIVTVNVVPVAVGFGGEVGNWHAFEIELPVIDQPAWSTSV